jgi:hypothetical protein
MEDRYFITQNLFDYLHTTGLLDDFRSSPIPRTVRYGREGARIDDVNLIATGLYFNCTTSRGPMHISFHPRLGPSPSHLKFGPNGRNINITIEINHRTTIPEFFLSCDGSVLQNVLYDDFGMDQLSRYEMEFVIEGILAQISQLLTIALNRDPTFLMPHRVVGRQHSDTGYFHYQKYLKYKQKYLELKKKLENNKL